MALIEPGTPNREVLVPQRKVESAPFTNCAVVDNTRQAIRAGLAFPRLRLWVREFRQSTGIAEIGPTGDTQGTRASDRMTAWRIRAPWYPISFGPWDPDTLFLRLRQGTIDGSLTVQYGKLPDEQRRWSPGFEGGHQFGLLRARTRNRRREVFIVDPLGLDPYDGEWMRWSALMDAAPTSFYAGDLYLQTIPPGATGMIISILPRTFLRPGSIVAMKKGTRVYRIDPTTHNLVARSSPLDVARESATNMLATVANEPQGRTPTGPFYHLLEGNLAGLYVRAGDADLKEGPVPGDCQAEVDEATLPLKQEIARQEAGIETAIRALEGV